MYLTDHKLDKGCLIPRPQSTSMDAVKENMQLICCGDLMSVRRHQTPSNYLDRKQLSCFHSCDLVSKISLPS